MSAIPLPPAYSEAPSEDLAAELAKMKAMMEQMRLEKERVEIETKRKAEEQEEARELAEIHKRLSEENLRLCEHINNKMYQQCPALLSSLSQHETILYYRYTPSSDIYVLSYIITNKNIYRVWGQGYPTLKVCVIYTFTKALTKKQTLFLEYGIANRNSGHGCLLDRLVSCHYSNNTLSIEAHHSAPKKFESVIRLIPGSYKNGDWKQLDGFFGMYFNEVTMELSEVPPPSV